MIKSATPTNITKQSKATCVHLTSSKHWLESDLNPFIHPNFPLTLSTVSRPPWTLFPKCFSSFPHGTCSLSVSCLYLALDDAYHPIWAAFPNNSTLQKCLVQYTCLDLRDYHPLQCPFPRDLLQNVHLKNTLVNYNSRRIPTLSFSHFVRHYYGNPS